MELTEITRNLGDYTRDCILITEAEPFRAPGPVIVWCNAAFTEMTGYAPADIIGKSPRILQGPRTDRTALDRIGQALSCGNPITETVCNYTKSGNVFWVELSIAPVRDRDGKCRFFLCLQRDVSARIEREVELIERVEAVSKAERALQAEKTRLKAIAAVAEHAQDLITICDRDLSILWANPAVEARTGHALSRLQRMSIDDRTIEPDGGNGARGRAVRDLISGARETAEVRNVDRDGTAYWTDIRVSPICDTKDGPDRFVVIERDVTEQRTQRLLLERTRRELNHAAMHDPLTGLPNRRGFAQAYARMAADARHAGHSVALMHLDLDLFKQINDTLGHAAGDAVLLAVSKRLQVHLDIDAFAARIGGDEFVVALPLEGKEADLEARAEALRAEISRTVVFGNAECRFGASIGYATDANPDDDPGRLLDRADSALYRAKRNGRNLVQGYSEALEGEIQLKNTIADELSHAIESGQMRAIYQPQIDAASGTLVGLEALLQWDHPVLGEIAPELFMPIAREMSLEGDLDRLMMEYALIDRAFLIENGLTVPRVAVNVSSHRLHSPGLLDQIDALPLSPSALAFELLESTFIEDADHELDKTLDALRRVGISIVVDDFGSGHASVSGLLRIRPEGLKIDPALMTGVTEDPDRRRLFELLVETGRTLGIRVTAEGVASAAHAEIARMAGCHVLQGPFTSDPMTTVDLLEKYAGQSPGDSAVA